MEQRLTRVLTFLFEESVAKQHHNHNHDIRAYLRHADTWHQLQTFRALLCQRPAVPPLPPQLLEDIDCILSHQLRRRILVPASSIPPLCRVPSDGPSAVNISLWRGDITALGQVTAIVNAANSALLGCFQPSHRCIDNVIHSAAGPRLRAECNRLMAHQGRPEPVGSAKVTPAYCAAAKFILHTVGPQLPPGELPTDHDKQLLASCYKSCLDEAEDLPPLPDGRLVVAFPCISTGLFCFPGRLAAQIAVDAVISWCKSHPDTPVTHIIFDVFLEKDEDYYRKILGDAIAAGTVTSFVDEVPASLPTVPSITETARSWLFQADYLLITAGAGLSAAAGLDFTSQSLFQKHFPAFRRLGLHRLYDTFGFDEWPSKMHKWAFYFTQLQLTRTWPASPLYASLLDLATTHFADRFFVRTSNADGFFPANGFPDERFSSPQGAFRYLQCLRNCRPDAYFRSKPYLDAALPLIDPHAQVLTDETKIPVCEYCGGEVFLCVRAGDWFNERPFQKGEEQYQDFLDELEREGKTLAILELGVGMNTPGVLRWPNEELVRWGEGKVKLIRGGEQASGLVDFDLEAEGNAIGIEGKIDDILVALLRKT
ncbi:Protein-ADP-ribose hydrolase [Lasiodiplodia hormozganensis]|uniref:Protein-ADP-ribose hydrolase n=1 Tax=Lasiodiplodia hormozganensis TaxID=869390 RepID=A0AA39Z537_9PEZI|nr:Protein-ADP-ribose hydrolase [Lasiodiplodia hormozganensis]